MPFFVSSYIEEERKSNKSSSNSMAPPAPSRTRRSSKTGAMLSSPSTAAPAASTRTSKRKAGVPPEPAPEPARSSSNAANNNKKKKLTKRQENAAKKKQEKAAQTKNDEQEEEVAEESQEDTQKRERALDLLRQADDLPSAYAALKLVKEIGGTDGVKHFPKQMTKLSKENQDLIQQASLAVPYLMHKMVMEEFRQPRTMGGLAFSDAHAKEVAATIFEKVGPAAFRDESLTEDALAKKVGGGVLSRGEARKAIPILRQVGEEAQSKVKEMRATLEAPKVVDHV